MPNTPRDARNRKGCFVTAAVVALFILIYLLVGLSAKPSNTISTKIETVPPAQQ